MEPMLKVTDLSVSYGHVEALRGVSIQVEQGQIAVSYTHLTLPTNSRV